MTDSQTTELLREGLTKHGIEWRSGLEGVTFVGDWCFVEYDNGRLAATCEPVLTSEQAIAATLGSDEPPYDELLRCLEHDWNIKVSWDGLRKFWNIELTEDGVKLRDAMHGTLTAEQVRESIERNFGKVAVLDDGKPVEWRDDWVCKVGIDYKGIADELNELGSGTCKLEPLSALDVTLNMLDQTEWGACSECGCAVPMDARFCNECGKAVKR